MYRSPNSFLKRSGLTLSQANEETRDDGRSLLDSLPTPAEAGQRLALAARSGGTPRQVLVCLQ